MIKIVKSSQRDIELTVKEIDSDAKITGAVSEIISEVKKAGDAAVRKYTKMFDGCELASFELDPAAVGKAADSVDPKFIDVLKRAAASIEEYHKNQIDTGFDLLPKEGIIMGQKVTPIARAGCYIPGGKAPYPSSVLMNCIPAKLAGVGEIILTTPPSAGNKKDNPAGADVNFTDPRILAAAKVAGVDRVFTIGGAQAIAALAYGTQTIPRVDKITGPGNAYVTEAKRQVFGAVGIDMLAGPSDILVIADKKTDPKVAAADMLSQCEHGADSRAVLVTDTMTLARKVRDAIYEQLEKLPRKKIAKEALAGNSIIIVASNINEAFEISNKLAPEHLVVLLDEPFNYLGKVINAGSVFLGKYTPETLGDYLAGPNHILPTSGTARFCGPLTVGDFCKKTAYTFFSKEAFIEKSADAICFAKEEGLDAHAAAVEVRLSK